jgi:hypothetical protein
MTSQPGHVPERRQFPRVPFQGPVSLQKIIESKSGNVFEVQGGLEKAQTLDLSENGIRLKFEGTDPVGKLLKLNIPLPKDHSLDIFTKVAWQADGTCGLQFVAMGPQVRKWVKSVTQGKE